MALQKCKTCRSPVYEGDPLCRHCGQDPARRPPLLGRRAWLGIAGCVALFAAGDSLVLFRERRSRENWAYWIVDRVTREVFDQDERALRRYFHSQSPDKDAAAALATALGFPDKVRNFDFRWLDLEDDAEEVGDREVENFPTILVDRDGAELFYGPLLPHHEHLRRLLQSLETA